ncbi:hypothetical protein [Nocardia wallacei]|uniref:hypothetical protein n=1 Tax=Nocardia wallacei TaxID=480035 RepID=UPI003CC7E8CE
MAQPLQQLELHALLDIVESMLEEGMDKKQLEALRRDLYRPEPGQRQVAGFTPAEEMKTFQAFQARLAGLRR